MDLVSSAMKSQTSDLKRHMYEETNRVIDRVTQSERNVLRDTSDMITRQKSSEKVLASQSQTKDSIPASTRRKRPKWLPPPETPQHSDLVKIIDNVTKTQTKVLSRQMKEGNSNSEIKYHVNMTHSDHNVLRVRVTSDIEIREVRRLDK